MTSEQFDRFSELHNTEKPLILVNAWDAASARMWQEIGAPAVATSSAAVAWSRGYPDGNVLPTEELLDTVRLIARVLTVPLTVDVEEGYSDDAEEVGAFVANVARAGAVGINIEDGGKPPELLEAKLRAIRAALGEVPLFINARTDVYLRGIATGSEAVQMTIARLKAYAAAGASCGFVPGLADVDEAAAISAAVPMPISVMTTPGLPSIEALSAAGVCRVSTGTALFKAAYGSAQSAALSFLSGNLTPTVEVGLDYGATNRLFATGR